MSATLYKFLFALMWVVALSAPTVRAEDIDDLGETEAAAAKDRASVARSTKSTVLEIRKDSVMLVSNPTAATYEVNEVLCLSATNKPVVCGFMVQSTSAGILFAASRNGNKVLQTGDTVLLIRRPRSPANARVRLPVTGTRHPELPNLTAISVGINLTKPVVRFEQSFTSKLALGLAVNQVYPLVDGGANVTGYSGLMFVSYYPSEAFHGFWLGAGAGIYLLKGERQGAHETTASATGWGALGWRFASDNYHLTLGAGGQYLLNPQFRDLPIRVNPLSPWGFLEVGAIF